MSKDTLTVVSESAPQWVRPTNVRYQVLAAACSLAFVAYIHRVGFARALPRLGLTSEQDGWLMAVFLLAYGGFEVPWGVLGDRLGSRHLLTGLVLGWSLTTALVTVMALGSGAWVFPFLLAIRFAFGMFQAGAFPVLSRVLTDWMTVRERASGQGWIWMSTRFGGVVVPLALGWLMDRMGDWERPLWILAGVGVVWCALFWPWFRSRPEEMASVNAAEREKIAAGRVVSAGHGDIPWRQMLSSRSVWGLCLMYGFGGFAANFYVTLLPAYLAKQREFNADTVSLMASLPFAFGMVSCLGGGLFSDWLIRRTGGRRWGRRINGALGLLVGAVGWLCLPRVEGTFAVAVILCLIFFCNDMNMGPAWASCADVGERYAGTVGGAMNMVGNLFGAVSMILAGRLFEQGRSELLFTIYAGSFVLASLSWLLVDVTRPLEIRRGSS